MSDFIESLKRLYAKKALKIDQLNKLLTSGKITIEELDYIKRKEG